MNTYLKSAVQNLDVYIAQITDMRNKLAAGLPGVGEPVPIAMLRQPPAVAIDVRHAGDQLATDWAIRQQIQKTLRVIKLARRLKKDINRKGRREHKGLGKS